MWCSKYLEALKGNCAKFKHSSVFTCKFYCIEGKKSFVAPVMSLSDQVALWVM